MIASLLDVRPRCCWNTSLLDSAFSQPEGRSNSATVYILTSLSQILCKSTTILLYRCEENIKKLLNRFFCLWRLAKKSTPLIAFLYLLACGVPDNARLRRYRVLDKSYSGILHLSPLNYSSPHERPLNCDLVAAFTPYTRKIAPKSVFSCTSRKKSVTLRPNIQKN